MNRTEKALNTLSEGFNCAQSVISAFAEDFGLEYELALKIAGGFGGGMGRLQKTCGAIAGALMVIGLKYGKYKKGDAVSKEKTHALVRQFFNEFTKIHGATDCKDLLNCDLNTEEGRLIFKNNNLHRTICEKCVKDATEIAEQMI